MKKYIAILMISLFSLSCERREIVFLSEKNKMLQLKCDSLSQIISFLRDAPDRNSMKYYVIGNEKVLLEKGVIVRVSGLSREMKINNKFPKKYFVAEPPELIDTLVVRGKDVRVIGNFHPDSYVVTGTESEDYHLFIIKDRKLFWDDSRFLVITHK